MDQKRGSKDPDKDAAQQESHSSDNNGEQSPDVSAIIDDITSAVTGSEPAPASLPAEEEKPPEEEEKPPEELSEEEEEQEVLTSDDDEPEEEPEQEETLEAIKARLAHVAAQRRYARQLARRLKKQADYHDKLQKLLKDSSVSPEQFDAFIAKGAEVGFDLAKLAPAAETPPAPEPPPEGKAPPASDSEVLDADLQQMVDDYEIHLDAATKLQRTRNAAKKPEPPAPPPKPEAPPSTAVDAPRLAQTETDKGEAAIRAVEARYSKKVGAEAWEKIAPKVQEAMADYPGLHPSKWGTVTEKLAKQAVDDYLKTQQAPPAAPRTLRSTPRTAGSRHAPEVPEDERQLAQSIVGILRGE